MKNGKQLKKVFLAGLILSILSTPVFSQEALKSAEENYYDMLFLSGITERNYLSYRTLSGSVWNFIDEEADHPWKENAFRKNISLVGDLSYELYGPEWYNSYNSWAPWGAYDLGMWQGRGYNTSLTGGARLEGYGLSLTIKPQLSYAQNLPFEYLRPTGFNASEYKGKAKEYGYIYGDGCDAVQRFGDNDFWTFDWGDTEIRYSWKSLTLGFGWQPIWLGPNYVHPLLSSNNAATYPKIDLGLTKQEVVVPWLNWNLGFVEGRIWTGYLTESDYFDNLDYNDHRLIHGLSMSYSPSFMKGFTINANRICIVHASWENMGYIIPAYDNTHIGAHDLSGEDQKMSITADWAFPQVGFEIYGEIGIDDFLPSGDSIIQGYLRWPFHTASYTVGAKKTFEHKNHPELKSILIFEWNNTEPSQDYQMWAFYNFGFHGQLKQGYTNRGQWLGSGYGYGGNSQHLEYRLYYPKGSTTITLGRNNPDNSYVFGQTVNTKAQENGSYSTAYRWLSAFKANAYVGVDTSYYVNSNFIIGGGILYDLIINNTYEPEKNESGLYRINTLDHNFQLRFTAKYIIGD